MCSHGNYPPQVVSVASRGPGWSEGGLCAGSPVVCVLEVVVCRASSPLHRACTSFCLTPQALCITGQTLGLCDHPLHPLVGFSVQLGM